MAAECRLVVACDVEARKPCFVPVRISTKSPPSFFVGTAPLAVPDLSTVETITVESPRYWPVTLSEDSKLWLVRSGPSPRSSPLVVFVKRKAGFLPYADDPKGVRSIQSEAFPTVSWLGAPGAPLFDSSAALRAFSNDPKIHAFAKLLCDSCGGEDAMATFFSRALLECITGEMNELLPVFVGLWDSALSPSSLPCDSEALANAQLVVASRSRLIDRSLLAAASTRLRSAILGNTQTRLQLKEYITSNIPTAWSRSLAAAISFLGIPSAHSMSRVRSALEAPGAPKQGLGKFVQALFPVLRGTCTESSLWSTIAILDQK